MPAKTQPTREIEEGIELLAPAGTPEAMRAAVENGADAVYFGLEDFNARMRAPNFVVKQLPEIVAWLHERGVRAYVAINTLAFVDELPRFAEMLYACSRAGVDGVMIQDLGVAYLSHKLVPDLPVHASTQMTLTAPESIAAVRELGLALSRVVAPRELDLAQITDLVNGSDVDIEVFIHGALCVAYSGQCLTSEALGGRSANRGECAQACRLPFDLIVDGKPIDTGDVKYLLSPKDLAAYNDIPRLLIAGVKSLKIEGRLKSPEYVAATVQAYRQALEEARRAQGGTEIAVDPQTRYRLEMVFSRGFTRGYLHRIDHQAVVEGRFPKKRGPYLGKVTSVAPHGITLQLAAPLSLGDGIVFDAGRPDLHEVGGRVYSIRVDGQPCQSVPPNASFPMAALIQLSAEKRTDLHRINVGDRVWKTSDPRLDRELKRTYETDKPRWKRPVDAMLRVRVGEPAELTLSDHWGISVSVVDAAAAQAARDRALTAEIARQQIGRLGNTPFELRKLKMDVVEPVFIPMSRLNDLRRRAVEALLAARRSLGTHRQMSLDALVRIREEIARWPSVSLPPTPQLNALCRTLDQVAVASLHPAVDTIYTDFDNLRWHHEARRIIRAKGKRFVPATLRIFKPRERNLLRAIIQTNPDAVLVRNLAAWYILRQWEPSLELIGDYSLNIANDISAWLLKKANFTYLTPSYDLNGEQLLDLLRKVPPAWFEVTIHQHMPMFHMEHCVFCRFLSEGNDYTNCGRPCDWHRVAVRDRMNYDHPVKADAGCRNTVYNAIPQSAAEYVPQLLEAGVRRFRVEFIEENSIRTHEALDAYHELLVGRKRAQDVWRELKALSKVGVTRGSVDHV
ncbi:MAG: U32 family peptidase [Candidatus Sumerlaeaceae bacterium]|nr:U32 family peptidase [Candidatus Sumerlaeaceae bacterium]